MYFRLSWFFCLLLCLHTTALAEISLRFGEHADYTRIVLEAPNEPLYRIFNLENPNRLVIDLREVKLSQSRNINKGLVKGYRFGQFEAGVTRIVIDLKDNFSIRKFFSLDKATDKGFRIVLDIEKSAKTKEFLRHAAGWNSYKAQQESAPAPVAETDTKAESTVAEVSAGRAPLPPVVALQKARPLIVIDAGHGGVDTGALGSHRHGKHEKHITLAAAQSMAQTLRDSGRYRVLLTRNKDIFLPLRKRFKIAEDNNAALLISLHADSLRKKSSVRGASVYTLSEKASDKEAEKLAARENAADSNAGQDYGDYDADLVHVLANIEQRGTRSESAKIAGHVVKTLQKDKQLRLLNNPHRFAGFAVLKSPSVPSILVEMGFISNPKEEKLLQTKKFHQQFSKTLLKAVDSYFDSQHF